MNKKINEKIIVLRHKINMNTIDPFIYFSNSRRNLISTSNSTLCSSVAILSVGRGGRAYKGLVLIRDFSPWLAEKTRLKKKHSPGSRRISNPYLPFSKEILDMVFTAER